MNENENEKKTTISERKTVYYIKMKMENIWSNSLISYKICICMYISGVYSLFLQHHAFYGIASKIAGLMLETLATAGHWSRVIWCKSSASALHNWHGTDRHIQNALLNNPLKTSSTFGNVVWQKKKKNKKNLISSLNRKQEKIMKN